MGGPSFKIPAHVLYREVDGQMVLLNLQTEQYFGLNQVGAHIITRLTEKPFEEAILTLTNDFDVKADVLRRYIDNLVAGLIDAGLLDRVKSD